MIRTLLIIVAACLGFYHGFAQEKAVGGTRTLSLIDAQNLALQNSAEMKNAQIDVLIAQKKIWETTAIGLPQINGKISYQNIFEVPQMTMYSATPVFPIPDNYTTHYHKKDSFQLNLGVKENITFELTATQLIFSGEYLVGLQASKVYKMLSEQNVEKNAKDIIEAVAGSYQTVLILKENKSILDSTYTTLQKNISDMEQMNKSGFIEETDVDQLKITAANIKNNLTAIERQIEVSENLLKMQIGIQVSEKIILTDRLKDMIESIDLSALNNTSFDASANINYKLLDTQEKLLNLNLKRHMSTCLPTIAAFFRYQKQMKEPEFNFNPPKVFGVSVDIPIFASGRRYVVIQQDKLELEKIKNTKEKVTNALTVEYTQAKSAYTTAIEKYNLQKESLSLSKKIYDRTLIKYKEGISSSLDLTQTHSQYLTAQGAYYTAIFDLLSAKNKLEKVVNQGQVPVKK